MVHQLRNFNLGTTPNSNMIEAVKTDKDGCKLIAFCRVINYPKCKPQYSPSVLADYKDGVLRIFNRNDYTSINVASFKEAIKAIRNFTDFKISY